MESHETLSLSATENVCDMTNSAIDTQVATSSTLLRRASSRAPEVVCCFVSRAWLCLVSPKWIPLCSQSLSFQPPMRLVQVDQSTSKPTLGKNCTATVVVAIAVPDCHHALISKACDCSPRGTYQSIDVHGVGRRRTTGLSSWLDSITFCFLLEGQKCMN